MAEILIIKVVAIIVVIVAVAAKSSQNRSSLNLNYNRSFKMKVVVALAMEIIIVIIVLLILVLGEEIISIIEIIVLAVIAGKFRRNNNIINIRSIYNINNPERTNSNKKNINFKRNNYIISKLEEIRRALIYFYF